MKKKFRLDLSVLKIIGFILITLAVIFTVVGIICFTLGKWAVLAIPFFGLGSQFIVIGGIFITSESKRQQKIQAIIKQGNYIEAEITEITQNLAFEEDGEYPYVINAKYEDEAGCVHLFRSYNLNFNPEGMLLSSIVRIYVKKDDYKYYYMDTNSILPEVKIH
jgi:hypothetical protein